MNKLREVLNSGKIFSLFADKNSLLNHTLTTVIWLCDHSCDHSSESAIETSFALKYRKPACGCDASKTFYSNVITAILFSLKHW